MNVQYKARFIAPEGGVEEVEVFISAVTITIRRLGEDGQARDLFWLVQDLVAYRNPRQEWELQKTNALGTGGRLVIQDSLLEAELLKKNPRLLGAKKSWNKWDPTLKLLLWLGGGFLVLLIFFYTWGLPWIGTQLASHFPKQMEIEMGAKLLPSSIAFQETDTAKTRILNEFYRELHFSGDYPIHITVVKSEQVNAYAIPGGNMVIYDAILEDMKTPDQLAALIAHESIHITQRHTLKSMFSQSSRQLFWYFLLGSNSGVAGYLIEQGESLKNLSFSRELETESDTKGLQMMAAAGLDPDGMLQLMELLEKNSQGPEPIGMLSTHPLLKERASNIRKLISTLVFEKRTHPELSRIFHEIYE